jgi:hypothetical protein
MEGDTARRQGRRLDCEWSAGNIEGGGGVEAVTGGGGRSVIGHMAAARRGHASIRRGVHSCLRTTPN